MKKLLLISFLLSAFVFQAQDVFEAARTGDVIRMETLIRMNPDTIRKINASGFSPLILAAYRNQLKTVEFLLQHGADVNGGSPEGPALLGACYKGNVELVEVLLNHKAEVNAQNSLGTSALMFAALSNNVNLVKLLLKNGAKKDLKEKTGKTALDYAQANQSKELISLLSQ